MPQCQHKKQDTWIFNQTVIGPVDLNQDRRGAQIGKVEILPNGFTISFATTNHALFTILFIVIQHNYLNYLCVINDQCALKELLKAMMNHYQDTHLYDIRHIQQFQCRRINCKTTFPQTCTTPPKTNTQAFFFIKFPQCMAMNFH